MVQISSILGTSLLLSLVSAMPTVEHSSDRSTIQARHYNLDRSRHAAEYKAKVEKALRDVITIAERTSNNHDDFRRSKALEHYLEDHDCDQVVSVMDAIEDNSRHEESLGYTAPSPAKSEMYLYDRISTKLALEYYFQKMRGWYRILGKRDPARTWSGAPMRYETPVEESAMEI